VYEWQGSDTAGRPVRRSVDEARRLLAEAGWPERVVMRRPASRW